MKQKPVEATETEAARNREEEFHEYYSEENDDH